MKLNFVRVMKVAISAVALGICTLLPLSEAEAGGYGNQVGVRARALGGAFRAIADDWTAPVYNPAGLAYVLDNQVGGSAGFFHNRYLYNSNVFLESSSGNEFDIGFTNGVDIPNAHRFDYTPEAGIVLRSPFWGETVFAFTAYQSHDQNIRWNLFNGVPEYSDSTFPGDDFSINLDVVQFQLSAAREFVEDKLSLGLGISLLRGDLNYTMVTLRDNPLDSTLVTSRFSLIPEGTSHEGFGWGVGFKLGALWKPSENLSFGAAFSPKSTITAKGDASFRINLPNDEATHQAEEFFLLAGQDKFYFTNGTVLRTNAEFEAEMVVPASISGGLAFKASDRLTVTLDGEYTLWSQFKGFDFKYTSFDTLNVPGNAPPLVTALAQTNLSEPVEWSDATRVMLGVDYALKSYVNILGGLAFDQSPTSVLSTRPQFIDNGDKVITSLGLAFQLSQWNLSWMSNITFQPDLTVTELTDINRDGHSDNLPGDISGERYVTAVEIAYRF